MPRAIKRELTYFEPRKCYKKKVNGQVIYVGKGSDRDTNENYQKAWAEFQAKLDEADKAKRGGDFYSSEAEYKVRVMVTANRGPGPTATTDEIKAVFAGTQHEGSETEAEWINRAAAITRSRQVKQYDAALKAGTAAPIPIAVAARTVGDMVKKFVDGKRQQAKTEQKSVGRFANIESYVTHFEKFIGSEKPIAAIDAVALSDYFNQQLEQIGDDTITCWAGRDRLQVAKQFIRFCWELGTIELPRNVDSKNLTISCTPGDVNPMPVAELQRRVKAATGRLKLELLLMANCGMYQVDIADLKHAEINFQTSTITRKRSKTKKEANAPTVTWNLWPSTVALLRAEASTESATVLATKTGKTTVHDSINSDGKASRTDATAQAYKRLQDALEGDRWPLKSIRKAAATAIGSNPDFARYVQYFLGQAPDSVASAHYVKPSAAEFAKCIAWLGEHFNFTTIEKIEKIKAE